MRSLFFIMVFAVTLCSCSQPASEAAKEPAKQYHIHGEVVRLNPQAKTATINAQKIDGWMEAMSMEYPVKDDQGLATLHPNDCIDATVQVQGNDFWVTDIKHSDPGPSPCVAPKTAAPQDKKTADQK